MEDYCMYPAFSSVKSKETMARLNSTLGRPTGLFGAGNVIQ